MFKDKDARMVVDMSGDWTSLSCYYILHDKVERLKGQVEYYTTALGKQEVLNQRLVKAGDELKKVVGDNGASLDSIMKACEDWNAAKG
jgi:hypothetical protein